MFSIFLCTPIPCHDILYLSKKYHVELLTGLYFTTPVNMHYLESCLNKTHTTYHRKFREYAG
jgi:hypothetical protein